jgi:phosphopantothenoylcysteine decarboxylase/phosphopantothenate--cysteine ligase
MNAKESILLIITGGIAAYKSLELIRLLRRADYDVRCVLTKAATQFVTPLSVAALSEQPVYEDLWSLKDEVEMGHIRLAREADLIVIAPASADFIAKIATGRGDDLASTLLLAADKPIMIAPAMNGQMWDNAATQYNINLLIERGMHIIPPEHGIMACGEVGTGRLPEVESLFQSIDRFFHHKPLKGKKAIVTSGATVESIDPVRFISNHSSGKQGHAIAYALQKAGAEVTLITGACKIEAPKNMNVIPVLSADDMLKAAQNALPADIAVFAAAVCDWRTEAQGQKLKKRDDQDTLCLTLVKNPDIAQHISNHKQRPSLCIGFAAETENLVEYAAAKRIQKNLDWILGNHVIRNQESVFGHDRNQITFIDPYKTDDWPEMSKKEIASRLITHIIEHFQNDVK